MSNEIINVLNALTEKFGIAIDWTSMNIIPYLEQLVNKYINYEITTSIIWIIVNFIMFISSFTFLMILYKKKDMGTVTYESGYVDKDKRLFFHAISYIGIFIALLVIITQIIDIATCLTMPEKMILKELKNIYIELK